MVIFNSLLKYFAALFLCLFFASASFAGATGPSLPSDRAYDRSFLTFKQLDLPNDQAVHSPSVPQFTLIEPSNAETALPLYKDGDKTIWSLAPSLSKSSLNPLEDIKNLGVILQFSMWF